MMRLVFRSGVSGSVADVNCRKLASRYRLSPATSEDEARKKKRSKTTNRRDSDVTVVARGRYRVA